MSPSPTTATEPVQPTGPVEFLPEPPPGQPAPAPAGSSSVRGSRAAWRQPARLVGPALVLAGLALLQAGLAVHATGGALWSRVPLWSSFATLACVLCFAAFAERLPGARRLLAGRGWPAAAVGLTGLAVFWLLVVLPTADTDRGFLLTAALGCCGAAVWRAAGRGCGAGGPAQP